MSCVCLWLLFVGYRNQVYTVRILELWFATLVTCGDHLGNFQKFAGAGAWVPPFKDWFDRSGVLPGPQFPQWISCARKVENLCSRDSYWTYSIRMRNNFFFVFLKHLKILIIVTRLIYHEYFKLCFWVYHSHLKIGVVNATYILKVVYQIWSKDQKA